MTIQENWALPTARIADYLSGLDEARRIAEVRYEIGGCEVWLQPLEESRVGSYAFPRTLVTFSGEEDAVTDFRRQRLRAVKQPSRPPPMTMTSYGFIMSSDSFSLSVGEFRGGTPLIFRVGTRKTIQNPFLRQLCRLKNTLSRAWRGLAPTKADLCPLR